MLQSSAHQMRTGCHLPCMDHENQSMKRNIMSEPGRKDGMAAALKHYAEYGARARELKDGGKQVIGYLTALTPVEIMMQPG